jgi:two-component system chemotaxis response regulator CheB
MPADLRSIRVLIVSADGALRAELGEALRVPGFSVAGAVGQAAAATELCQDVQPDVAVVDAALPAGEGFSAVQDIMAFRPTPILVLAQAVSGPEAFQALALGALDVMARPRGVDKAAFAVELTHRLRLLSGVRVIQHVRGRRKRKREGALEGPPVVGIAASLGGPRALAILLKGLPRDLGAPVCVVQHISDGFVDGLAGWLSSESGMPVQEAQDGSRLEPGAVLVAPCGVHLTAGGKDQVELDDGPPVEGFRPSATRLFCSLAQRYGRRAVGVVLTGMGRDGAEGIAAIRAAGGHTLAQDEATSTVWGMPRAAVETGAVQKVVPIDEMAAALLSVVRELTSRGEPR